MAFYTKIYPKGMPLSMISNKVGVKKSSVASIMHTKMDKLSLRWVMMNIKINSKKLTSQVI